MRGAVQLGAGLLGGAALAERGKADIAARGQSDCLLVGQAFNQGLRFGALLAGLGSIGLGLCVRSGPRARLPAVKLCIDPSGAAWDVQDFMVQAGGGG